MVITSYMATGIGHTRVRDSIERDAEPYGHCYSASLTNCSRIFSSSARLSATVSG
jgi:hypothetical protein